LRWRGVLVVLLENRRAAAGRSKGGSLHRTLFSGVVATEGLFASEARHDIPGDARVEVEERKRRCRKRVIGRV
jgi:hypothetical protein